MSIFLEEYRKIDFQNNEDKYDNIGFDWDYEEMYYRFIAYTEYKFKNGKIDENTLNELINKATEYEKERRRAVEKKYAEIFKKNESHTKDEALEYIDEKYLNCEYDYLDYGKARKKYVEFIHYLVDEYKKYMCNGFISNKKTKDAEAREIVKKIKSAFGHDIIVGKINLFDDIENGALLQHYKKELNIQEINDSDDYDVDVLAGKKKKITF